MSGDIKEKDSTAPRAMDGIAPPLPPKPPAEAVGYGQPPRKRRWKKGQTGNPKGRPRKRERSWSDYQLVLDTLEVANKEITVGISGKKQKMPTYKALLESLFREGLRGNIRAAKLALEYTDAATAERSRQFPDAYQLLKDYEHRMAKCSLHEREALAMEYFTNLARRLTRES